MTQRRRLQDRSFRSSLRAGWCATLVLAGVTGVAGAAEVPQVAELATDAAATPAIDAASTGGTQSTDQGARKQPLPLWELGVGAAAFNTSAYPGASEHIRRWLVAPYFQYRGKVFRADQEGIGARLVDNDRVEFDVGFAASLPAHSRDVAMRRGMPDLGALVEFGPRVKYKFADLGPYTRWHAELALRTVLELRGGLHQQGYTVEPRLVWEQRGGAGRWSVSAQLAAIVGDRRINGYFYDVAPAYATADRPAYRAASGLLLVRTGLFGTWKINRDVRAFSFVRLDGYGASANRDSPLLRKSTGTSAGIGLAWTLMRSSARAGD